jgi:hypothetical protein
MDLLNKVCVLCTLTIRTYILFQIGYCLNVTRTHNFLKLYSIWTFFLPFQKHYQIHYKQIVKDAQRKCEQTQKK